MTALLKILLEFGSKLRGMIGFFGERHKMAELLVGLSSQGMFGIADPGTLYFAVGFDIYSPK